jgi:hypothetical protein
MLDIPYPIHILPRRNVQVLVKLLQGIQLVLNNDYHIPQHLRHGGKAPWGKLKLDIKKDLPLRMLEPSGVRWPVHLHSDWVSKGYLQQRLVYYHQLCPIFDKLWIPVHHWNELWL